MGSGMRLKEVTISGFRGYGEKPETIDLSSPTTLLVGGNRSGKSSTLNAIEWAVYGNEVIGGKVGIDERKGWLVGNRNCEKAKVELVLESGSGEIKVCREMPCRRKRGGDTFYFLDEAGNSIDDEDELWKRVGLGPKGFMSSVYLHQEVVRDILVVTPEVRKSALDRLLGVSDLRNLYDAFKAVKVSGYEKKVLSLYENLELLVDARAHTYKEALEEAIEAGEDFGLGKIDFKVEGFKKRCESTLKKLSALARKAKVKPADVALPSGADGLDDFSYEVRDEIKRLRVENPGAESQRKLDGERRALDLALSNYLGAVEELKDLKKEKRDTEKEEGTLEELEKKKSRLEGKVRKLSSDLEQISDRINVVNETISYLEKLPDKKASASCPACEQPIVPEKLLKSLEKAKEETSSKTEEFENEKELARKSIRNTSRTMKRLGELIDEEMPDARELSREAKAGLEDALGRKFKKGEDPEVIVEKRLEEIAEELEANKKLLKEYVEGLGKVEELLEGAASIADVLVLRRKISKLNAVKKSKEWEDLNKARNRLNEELEYVDRVKETVGDVLRKVSQKKVREARGRIMEIYRMLVERPDFDGIEIDPDNYDVFAVSDGDREKLITFFNQGDMNCAALSIFLALGTGRKDEGTPSFLMLDDPSQSLDSVQKNRLAEVLNRIAKDSQVVLSTMDEELMQIVRKAISKKKKIFMLGEWDHINGPSITEA